MITLEEAKLFLKVDYEDDDVLIESLIETSEQYLFNATGKKFAKDNKLAILYCKTLIYEWYKDRGLTVVGGLKNDNPKIRYTLQSILLQLQYSDEVI